MQVTKRDGMGRVSSFIAKYCPLSLTDGIQAEKRRENWLIGDN